VYVKEMEERMAAGEVIGKKRKGRSDKGSKRGPRNKGRGVGNQENDGEDSAGDSAGEGPSKRPKVSAPKKAKTTKGKEIRTTGKSKRGTKSAKSQVPPSQLSQEIISDTDLDTDG
jgi:hypothetical protein